MKVGAATLQLLVPLCLVSLLLVFNTQARRPDLEPEAVVDRQGDPLQPGVGYYVWPFGEEKGGLAWLHRRNQPCPLYVIREPDLIGYHVKFSAPPGLDYIPTLTNLTIEMPILGPCLMESRVWRLNKVGSDFWFISTGGVAGDLYSKFQIVRREVEGDHGYEIYSFEYCPISVPDIMCLPVGTFVDSDGTIVMAVGVGHGIKPYYVWFEKVYPTTYPNKNQGFSIV